MVHASLDGWRRGRTVTLAAGGLLLAGLFGLLRLGEAAQPPAAGKGARGAGAKAPVVKPTGPMTLKMTITSRDPDVLEMSKAINAKFDASWKANKITPSHYVDDYEFIRRASLDIIGRIATLAEIKQYLRDPPDRRRSLLIDRLLQSDDYPRHWANLWSNWLLTRSGPFGRGKYHDQMTVWLEDQFAQNKRYSEWVTRLLTAKGRNDDPNNKDAGAVNFILAHVGEPVPRGKQKEEGQFEMVPLTSRITRVFLGTQVQCAQCHPHPFFDSLKQEQFWGINAFLRQVERGGNPMPRRMMGQPPALTLHDNEDINPDANVFFEQRNGKVRMWKAEFLPAGGKERGPRLDPKYKGVARREQLALYLVDHEMFPRAIVNRMWGLFLGRGFVNPTDDFNDNNKPTKENGELLDEVAARFKHYNYDLKKLIRWITHSRAYHLSYVANPSNDKVEQEQLFSRMIMKAMTPEQLFESLMVATKAEAAENAKGKKALRDKWLGSLISNFGDDEGNEVNFNGTVVQALMMMNGQDINTAIARKDKGTVALAMRTKGAGGVINELYLAALNRPPRASELRGIQAKMRLRGGFVDSLSAQYEDLFWALLNSNEFILNH
jgi:hypothetical protein